jgi:iron complex transport system ATP-binding protein
MHVSAPALAVDLRSVSVEVAGVSRPLLRDIRWQVRPGEHWAVIGANGAGKTTLMRLVTGEVEPTTGSVTVLGGRVGVGGLRDPALRIGLIGGQPPTYARQLTALDVVVLQSSGPAAMIGARVTEAHRAVAHELLALFAIGHLAGRRYSECSLGERQRILLARVLMRDPELLLFDEPITGLDLPGREGLLRAMTQLPAQRPQLATVTVSHHLEELPPTTTHALLLRDGVETASGPVAEVITEQRISEAFGLPIAVSFLDGRWAARVVAA